MFTFVRKYVLSSDTATLIFALLHMLKDGEWEDEDAEDQGGDGAQLLSELLQQFAPAEDYGFGDEEEDDPDAAKDPINQIELQVSAQRSGSSYRRVQKGQGGVKLSWVHKGQGGVAAECKKFGIKLQLSTYHNNELLYISN